MENCLPALPQPPLRASGQAFLCTAGALPCCGANFFLLGPTETDLLWSVVPEWKIKCIETLHSPPGISTNRAGLSRAKQGREVVASPLQPANEGQGTQVSLWAGHDIGLGAPFASGCWLQVHSKSQVTASSPGTWDAAATGQAWKDALTLGHGRHSMMGDTLTLRRQAAVRSGPLVDKVMNIFCRFSYWASFCSLLIFKCYLFWKDVKRKERSGFQQLYHVPFCSYFCKAAKLPFEKWKT